MKKLSAVLLSAAMLISSAVMPVNAANIDEEKWDFLMNFDIIYAEDIESTADNKISRGEYISYLMYLMNKGNLKYDGDSLFTDIDEYSDCFEMVNIARQLGYVNETEFREDDDITYAEAKKMLLRAMGYSDSASMTVSAPDIPVYNSGYKITYNDMVEMFYAAMHEPILKYDISVGDSVKLTIDENKTILSEYYDIEIIEGIVTENRLTTLYSGDKRIDSYIGIDNIRYCDTANLGEEWLGYSVRAYVDYSKNDEEGNVAYIVEKANKNSEVTVSCENIEDVKNDVSKITYIEEGIAKAKYKRIDENVNVIYNGKAYTDYTAEDLMPENGNVTLLDNDGDEIVDVVKIWSYETMFIERISQAMMLYNDYEFVGALTELDLNEYVDDMDYEIYENDSKKEFSRLKPDQVISVARSKGSKREYIRIELSTREESGTYEGLNREEMEITISGKTYKIVPEFLKQYTNMQMRKKYKFYLDCFGQIAAAFEIPDNEYSYVYMYSIVYDEAEGAAFLKIFNVANEWKSYIIDSKIKYNGKSVEPYMLTKYNYEAKRNQLIDEFGDAVSQVINVKIVDDKITEIETAVVDGETGTFNTSGKKNLRYYGQNKSFGHEYFVLGKTVIFAVPMNDPANLDAYKTVINPSWDKDYQVEAYGWDEYYGTSAFVMQAEDSYFKKSIADCLILKKDMMIDSNGTAVECVKISFKGFEELNVEIADNFDASSLNSGDIGTVKIDEEGKMYGFDMPSHRSYSWVRDGKTPSRPDNLHLDSMQRGTIIKVDPENEIFLATLDNTGKRVAVKADFADLIIRRFDTKKKTCQISTLYELEPGDFFVMYSGGSYVNHITVYDEE